MFLLTGNIYVCYTVPEGTYMFPKFEGGLRSMDLTDWVVLLFVFPLYGFTTLGAYHFWRWCKRIDEEEV